MRTAGLFIVVGCATLWSAPPEAFAARELFSPATPAGVTQEPVIHAAAMQAGVAMSVSGGAFGDANGMTLYVFDGDTTLGRSNCSDACADAWPALVAPSGAKPLGDWSLVPRSGGIQQWAYRGRPLYRSSRDTVPGTAAGNGVDGVWHVASGVVETVTAPASIALRPVADALGEVFVDFRGMTLYSFVGDTGNNAVTATESQNCDNACLKIWRPVTAGSLAKPTGDWSIAQRGDGSRQWAYRGHPLFTYAGDGKPGDAKGQIADPRWRPAVVSQYYLPPEVKPRINGRTTVLATAEGKTLYTRDKFRFSFGGYSVNDGPPATPAIGRSIGVGGCQDECLKTWTPLVASGDALPSGFWSIAARPDGTRQWAYQGYPVYTNVKDKKPGDMLGRDQFDLTDGSNALYWRVITP